MTINYLRTTFLVALCSFVLSGCLHTQGGHRPDDGGDYSEASVELLLSTARNSSASIFFGKDGQIRVFDNDLNPAEDAKDLLMDRNKIATSVQFFFVPGSCSLWIIESGHFPRKIEIEDEATCQALGL